MTRFSNSVLRARRRTMIATISAAVTLGTFVLVTPSAASAAPARAGAPAALPGGGLHSNAPHSDVTTPASQRPPALTPLSAVDPGPNGTNRPATTGSPADTPIAALPALDPGPNDAPTVAEAPVPQNLPVTPSPITLATQPGQSLVDQTANDALNTIAAAGPYVSGGTPNLDANQLQPQVSSAQPGDPFNPATLPQVIAALASGNIPPPLPFDPLALLQKLPNGIPQITYRLCSESATKPVSCSITLPLGAPALLNVTGDGSASSPDRTPDVLADLIPTASVDSITSSVQQLLNDQSALVTAQATLAGLLSLLTNPLYLATHPGALLQKLNLQSLIASLKAQVQNDLLALASLINVGLGFLELRLGTSEVPAAQPLKAHVWAVYDIPGYHRLSLGLDGYRRGDALPWGSLSTFTFNPAAIAQGIYDVHAEMDSSTTTATALTAGISSITQNAAGNSFDPTVASVRFAPFGARITAHAIINPSGETDQVETTVKTRTHVDALIFSNRHSGSPPADQYTELKIDTLPNTVSATLQRPTSGGSTTVTYRASDTIDSVLFANYEYSAGVLQHALQATAFGVPASIDLNLVSGQDSLMGAYQASSSLNALGLAFYDRAASISGTTGPIVARGALSSLPTMVFLQVDRAAKHIVFSTDTRLGAAALQASYQLGSYAPLTGDHATFIGNGTAFGADLQVSGLHSAEAYYDTDPRVTLAFNPGGQSFTAAAIVDGHQKFRAFISNLPSTLSVGLDTVNRKFTYNASAVINQITAAYVDTTSGPSIVARIDSVPQTVTATWDLGSAPHINYQASSGIPLVNFFASPQGVQTVDPHGNDYLSASVTNIPKTVDVLLDLPNSHIVGTSSDALGSITVAARAPFNGREWQAVGGLTNVPATFTADFANGTFDFHAISGPLGAATLTVSNHGDPLEPTSPAHLAVHYDQLTGDVDASAGIINLTEIGYVNSGSGQQLILQADEGSNPLQIDANILLTANNVADTRLTALGAITGLPSNVTITFGGGKITYSADKHVGIELGVRLGKVAALSGLGAPLPANGIAAVAKACATGPGCASDSSPFCSAFASCLGAVANINMSGLPTSAVVDLSAGTVSFTSYQPPAGTLVLYVRLIGLLASLPDAQARATLSGLPASLDFTAGPFTIGGGTVDAKYQASAPLGTLAIDVDTTTTNATFPHLRVNATISELPQSLHMTANFGSAPEITFDNSDKISTVSARVTSPTTGYLSANIDDVPKTADILVDVPNSHAEATMSSAITDITVVAHVPYNGRTWNAFAQATSIPGHFTADFGAGTYGFKALSGPLGSATFAVSNYAGATVPDTADYLAVHYDQLSGNVDAGAQITQLSDVEYAEAANGNQSIGLQMGAATLGIDADVVLAVNGARDTRYSASGTLTTPSSVHVNVSNGHIVYQADQSAALALSVAVGKTAALSGLNAPLYPQGVGVVARSCGSGAGCANDSSIFCSVFSSCFGAVANLNLPGLPTKVDIDTNAGTVDVEGMHPTSGPLKVFAELDNLITSLPRIRALATMTGLPNPLNLTVGPIGNDRTDPTKFSASYHANNPIGTLRIDADAQTTIPGLGDVRGQFIAGLNQPLPATFSVSGTFGSHSHVTVANSGDIDQLRVQATATLGGTPGSAAVQFTDVPAHLDIDVGSAGSADGVNAPDFTYTACADNSSPCDSPKSTLDGLVQVDAQLSAAVGPAHIGTNGAYFRFTNLGADTTVGLDTSNYHLTVNSTPGTDSFQMGLNISVGDIPNTSFSDTVFSALDTDIIVDGHYGLRPSHIGDIEMDIEDLHSLLLQPGDPPFGLPALVGLLFPGVTGDYGTFSMNMFDVDVNPDVHVHVWADAPGPFNPDIVSYSLPTHIDNFWFHRYDMKGYSDVFTVSVADVVCFTVKQKPEVISKSPNSVTLSGSDGPQTFNFIDYNDEVPDVLVDVFAALMSPFGHDFDHDTDFC